MEMPGRKEALPKVSPDNLFRLADRRQIGPRVPLQQQIKIIGKPGQDCRRDSQIRLEQGCNCGFGERSHRKVQYLRWPEDTGHGSHGKNG